MESLEITFDPKRSKETFDKYFRFKRKQELKKFPGLWIFGLCVLLVLAGVFLEIDALWILGLIIYGSASIFLLYFLARFQLAVKRFHSGYTNMVPEADRTFLFSFDDQEISKRSPNSFVAIKWELIKKFEEHENDLYLYLENGELYDIISRSVLGNELFGKFREMLIKSVKAC